MAGALASAPRPRLTAWRRPSRYRRSSARPTSPRLMSRRRRDTITTAGSPGHTGYPSTSATRAGPIPPGFFLTAATRGWLASIARPWQASLGLSIGSRGTQMTSALANLRILDFTTTIAGPHCTRLFADLGAEVIKVESPEGDMMRARMPLRGGASTSFGQLNTGKKSVVIDLKRPEGVTVVRRLVESCDVLVENFRP